MKDKHLVTLLLSLVFGSLLICGVVIPFAHLLIQGLWPYKEFVSLTVFILLVLVIVNVLARQTLKNLAKLNKVLPDLLEQFSQFLHRWRSIWSHDTRQAAHQSDYPTEQGLPMMAQEYRYTGEKW